MTAKPTGMNDPEWLVCAREAMAIAQSGLAYETGMYDRERYEQLQSLAARMISLHVEETPARITRFFSAEQGYATPKIDVRVAVFDASHRLLMVREKADHDRWTLPGGWADVNLTASENALKELREESGYEGRIVKLAAAWDRARQGHPPDPFSALKLFYIAECTGGDARVSTETSGVGWFSREDIPQALSTGRVLPHEIALMFTHHDDPARPTDYD